METGLLYLDNTYLFESSGKILRCEEDTDGYKVLVLDQTNFYPQGGGQPFDTGIIQCGNATFRVKSVRFSGGEVIHRGQEIHEKLNPGDFVMMRVDSERRLKNARSHTAGHLLDTAIRLCGIDIVPGKGYHFPDGPYVEYIGELEPMKKEALIPELQTEINRLIASSLKLSAKLINKESLPDFCSFVPPNIPNDQQVRVVFINDQDGCPCGGTHVENTADLKEVLIRKISSKKGVTRVSYSTI